MTGDRLRSGRRLMALGLSMEAGFLLLGHPSTTLAWKIAIQGILFLAYLAAVREVRGRSLAAGEGALLLGLAMMFRLTLVFQQPFYSDDLYRYLWDGHVQVAGHLNPYRFAPADPAVAPWHNEIQPLVNHPEIPTLYPPWSQIFFAAVTLAGGSVAVLKGSLVLFDLAQILLLRAILRRFALSAGRMLIYAWSPLVITEVAGNGHLDALAIFFLILGIHLIIVARPGLSTIPLGLSAGAKLLPLLVLPVLAPRVPKRYWPLPFVLMAAAVLPYLSAGPALLTGLRQYAERWQHNDSLFRILLGGLQSLDPTPPIKSLIAWLQGCLGDPAWIPILYHYAYPVYLARFLVALILGGTALILAWKKAPPLWAAFFLLGETLLLSPTVHPWYLLWVLPFLPLFPSRAWILLSGLVPLSYLDPAPVVEGAQQLQWVRWVEYLPFYACLLFEGIQSWRGKAGGLFGIAPLREPAAGEGQRPAP